MNVSVSMIRAMWEHRHENEIRPTLRRAIKIAKNQRKWQYV